MMMKMKTKLIREMGGTEDLLLLRWVLLKKLKLLLTNLIPRCGHCKNLAPEDFSLEAAEKFIAECIPTVTIFSKDPAHHPNVIKFVISPNAKALLAEIYDAQAILTGKALDLTQIHNGDCKDLGCVVEVQIVHFTQKMC